MYSKDHKFLTITAIYRWVYGITILIWKIYFNKIVRKHYNLHLNYQQIKQWENIKYEKATPNMKKV